MENGVNESSKKANTADRAGWLKKSSGGILGYWKDRYVLLCKAQLLVYENEDEQNCLETVELENYDRCQDLRALLKRKHRIILIRSPGKKVADIKFQAKNLEEKETWIKAFSDGIAKGKNKVFDEVTVDPKCVLEHVTRDRVKVAQGRRRPPTRIHLKEVADGASDGIMRLDLDAVDHGSHRAIPDVGEEETEVPPKEHYKPPMPPTNTSLSPSVVEAEEDDVIDETSTSEPPCPPPKVRKEWAASMENLDSSQADHIGKGDSASESAPKVSTSLEDITKDPLKAVSKAPIPPPKVISDKMKVKWDEPAPEYKAVKRPEKLESSKENLHSSTEKEIAKPPVPPPKILSSKPKTKNKGPNARKGSLEATDRDTEDEKCFNQGTSEIVPEKSLGNVPKEPEASSIPAKSEKINGEKLDEGEINVSLLGISLTAETDPITANADLGQPKTLMCSTVRLPPGPKVRSSSVGDILDAGLEGPTLHLKKGHLDEMEFRLASGREKTEMLLHQILQGELVRCSDGNGPKATAETLLSEAVEQLRQASQVLQEMKDLELSKDSDPQLKTEKQMELVARHRRSVP